METKELMAHNTLEESLNVQDRMRGLRLEQPMEVNQLTAHNTLEEWLNVRDMVKGLRLEQLWLATKKDEEL